MAEASSTRDSRDSARVHPHDARMSAVRTDEDTDVERIQVASTKPQAQPTPYERRRDWLLRLHFLPFCRRMRMLQMFLVVGDGAFFFFLMMGWHTITPQSHANYLMNISLQILCALFTLDAVEELPWRFANAVHLRGPHAAAGKNFYGRHTDAVWFNLSERCRLVVVALQLANVAFQFANQATRIVYPTYKSTEAPPGSIWVNVFFVAAFAAAIAAAVYQGKHEARLRAKEPERFGKAPSMRAVAKDVDHQAQNVLDDLNTWLHKDHTHALAGMHTWLLEATHAVIALFARLRGVASQNRRALTIAMAVAVCVFLLLLLAVTMHVALSGNDGHVFAEVHK